MMMAFMGKKKFAASEVAPAQEVPEPMPVEAATDEGYAPDVGVSGEEIEQEPLAEEGAEPEVAPAPVAATPKWVKPLGATPSSVPAQQTTPPRVQTTFSPATGKVATAPAPAPKPYVESDPQVAAGHNSKNERTRAQAKLLSDVGALGRAEGGGARAGVAMLERVVDAGCDGIIGTDGAEKIYDKFRNEAAKARGKDVADAQGDASKKVQVSKLRQIIEVAVSLGEPAKGMFLMARDMHVQFMSGDDKKNLKVKSTYEALVNVAREQLKDEHKGEALNEEQIAGTMFKDTEQEEVTGLDLVKRALKSVENAMAGAKSTDSKPAREPLSHENLSEAEAHLRFVIEQLDSEFFKKEQEAEQARAAKAAEKEAKAAEKLNKAKAAPVAQAA
jgi:hypothetical protein